MNAVVYNRSTLHRGWRRLLLLTVLVGAASAVKAGLLWERSWYISFNWTQSLPFWAFLVDETAVPKVGDYVDFWPPENLYYHDISFVKRIVAGPGDEVRCEGRAFFVGDRQVALAKTSSQAGDPLAKGPCGVVPADSYFVVTPHKDSFDSRYEVIGYVPRSRIRGVAQPLL